MLDGRRCCSSILCLSTNASTSLPPPLFLPLGNYSPSSCSQQAQHSFLFSLNLPLPRDHRSCGLHWVLSMPSEPQKQQDWKTHRKHPKPWPCKARTINSQNHYQGFGQVRAKIENAVKREYALQCYWVCIWSIRTWAKRITCCSLSSDSC